jgi:hypothetical protein
MAVSLNIYDLIAQVELMYRALLHGVDASAWLNLPCIPACRRTHGRIGVEWAFSTLAWR